MNQVYISMSIKIASIDHLIKILSEVIPSYLYQISLSFSMSLVKYLHSVIMSCRCQLCFFISHLSQDGNGWDHGSGHSSSWAFHGHLDNEHGFCLSAICSWNASSLWYFYTHCCLGSTLMSIYASWLLICLVASLSCSSFDIVTISSCSCCGSGSGNSWLGAICLNIIICCSTSIRCNTSHIKCTGCFFCIWNIQGRSVEEPTCETCDTCFVTMWLVTWIFVCLTSWIFIVGYLVARSLHLTCACISYLRTFFIKHVNSCIASS